MNKKNYKKKYEFQKRMASRQASQIEELKIQIDELKKICKEKDEVIDSVGLLKNELTEDIADFKKQKDEYKKLVIELKKMKRVINETVFKGRWKIIKFLIK